MTIMSVAGDDDKSSKTPSLWLDHFSNIEHEWMMPVILQQEEAMLAIAEKIRMSGVHDVAYTRAMAANMLMSASLGVQWRMAPRSQEQMIASMVIAGPWDALRNFIGRTGEAERLVRVWKRRYMSLLLAVIGACAGVMLAR